MLLFCVHFNSAVLQSVVGGGKEMENDFWMESCTEASPLPAPGTCCHPAAALQHGLGHQGGPSYGPAPLGASHPKVWIARGFSPKP